MAALNHTDTCGFDILLGRTRWILSIVASAGQTKLRLALWNLLVIASLYSMVGCERIGKSSLADIRPLSHDFGPIRQNQSVRHLFRLQNSDSVPIQITKAASSCRCTIPAGIDGVTVQPGAYLDVPVDFNATGKSGRVETSVSLFLKGKESPKVLQLVANVVRELPDVVDFGKIKRGVSSTQSFNIDTFPGQPMLEILQIKNTNDWLIASFEQSDQVESSIRVDVIVGAEPPFGQFDVPLHIETNDTGAPRKVVHAKGYVLPVLELSEREVYFGELQPDTQEARVEVYSPYNEPVELVSVDNSRATYFTWSLTDNQNQMSPTSITISIKPAATLPPEAKAGIVKGEFRVHARVGITDRTDRIEVYGLVPARGNAQTTVSASS